MVSSPLAPVYGDQHRGAQAGHQGQQRVTQGQVSDKQERQAPGGGLRGDCIKSSVITTTHAEERVMQ